LLLLHPTAATTARTGRAADSRQGEKVIPALSGQGAPGMGAEKPTTVPPGSRT
jgi:hypothetical protein